MIKVVKVIDVPDPGTNYVRWITPPAEFTYVNDENSEPCESITFEYCEGRREYFGFPLSGRRVEFVSDNESDLSHTHELFKEVYDMALKDFSEALGVPWDHLGCHQRMTEYFMNKRGIN